MTIDGLSVRGCLLKVGDELLAGRVAADEVRNRGVSVGDLTSGCREHLVHLVRGDQALLSGRLDGQASTGLEAGNDAGTGADTGQRGPRKNEREDGTDDAANDKQ